MSPVRSYFFFLILLGTTAFPALAAPLPACRLDGVMAKPVEVALRLATGAYAALGRPLRHGSVFINPSPGVSAAGTLSIFIVKDASVGAIDEAGCIRNKLAVIRDEELDDISVRGGCVAAAAGIWEIRCSADAVALFGYMGSRTEQVNPALLYVLAHELAHILQRRAGEYAGRVEPILLEQPAAAKLELLRQSCDASVSRKEVDADALATKVMARLLPESPFREPVFSRKGSVLWGADQLHLAANKWQKLALEREFISQRKPHRSFIATEFPTPPRKIEANARQFVCEVLKGNRGTVLYPGDAVSHPPLEIRMQRVAEALKPIAASLPGAEGKSDYRPVVILQEQVSEIFTFMYQENGAYLEGLQNAICTRVNSEQPVVDCRSGR